MMDGLNLQPDEVFQLPSFKKNKIEQVRQIQME